MSEHKALTGVKIKNAEKGQVEAVFSTFDVIDHDKDVTVPDAFEDGQAVKISAYGHTSHMGALPVGRGVVKVNDTEALLDGQFFLSTQHGRDTFETVKEMGELQQWSYGYDILESDTGEFEGEEVQFLRKLRVIEVSPVLEGAGIDTRTVAVKQGKTFADEAEHALGCVEAFVKRAQDLGSLRAKQHEKSGRVLSAANRERLLTLLNGLSESSAEIRKLLEETDPEKYREVLIREFARFQHSI
jgi:hypothetical protein